jgi:transposase-like protein
LVSRRADKHDCPLKETEMEKVQAGNAALGVEWGASEAGEAFREFVREQVREIIIGVMASEVESLCGPSYRPKAGGEFFRAGSAPGYVLHEGRRHDVKRPRVRKLDSFGRSREATLASYAEAQDAGELRRRIMEALQAGVSGREQARLHGDSTPGVSKSEVSRLWVREGEKILGSFRGRDIGRSDWLVLMLDGVALEKDLVAVVALGVASDGTKLLLDFELGASESEEVAKALLARLKRRGFTPAEGCRLLAVLDGAAALRQAVSAHFPGTAFQRCLVHKERNLRRYMRRQDWPELSLRFDRLRKAEGDKAGREALSELERFLSGRNAAALESLREGGDDLVGLHGLNVPATLNQSLLSTNLIENPFRNVRRKTTRVCRRRKDANQASRRLAYALLEAERGFRRLRNHKDMDRLREALRRRE